MTRVFLRLSVAVCCLAAGLSTPGLSQQKPPRRVKLAEGADTNSADAYYQYGARMLRDSPSKAGDAFYWAHRLTPDWPEPLYGQWIAAILSRRGRLPEYLEGRKATVTSKEYRSIDSLYYRALALNPFVYRRFDRLLFDEFLDIIKQRYESRTGETVDPGELRHEFDTEVMSSPELRGWMAYAEGRWDDAVAAYGSALKGASYKVGLLAARARAEFQRGDYPGARADMMAALQERRQTEDKDLVYFYDSKAVFEHSLGIIDELMNDRAAAREDYAGALQEDLSYHQGHVRLAALALEGGDTATAISEYDLAAQIRGDDPVVRYHLGTLLRARGRYAEAVDQLKAAIAAEPWYAPPYVELGRAYEGLGRAPEARAQYQAFVAHAGRDHPEVAWAKQRVEALASVSKEE